MFLLPVHQQYCNYKITFQNLSPKTIKGYKSMFNNYLNHAKISHISEFTQHSVEFWIIDKRTHNNWSPKTIRNGLVSLSTFGDWLVNRKIIEENPVKNIPKPKLPKQLPKHLTKEQAQLLLDWAKSFRYIYKHEKNRAIAIIGTFLHTGIRKQELIDLRLDDINLESNVVTIIAGKGNKDRVIPLSYTLKELLKPYLAQREKINDKSPYFFVNRDSNNKLSDMVIKRLFDKLKKKTKFNVYSHLLRHTFATLMLQGGCDIFSLSKMMGHSDIKTTTIYLSATTIHLQSQMVKHPLNY
jgi:site-specific recombinase XerD